jgi:hypothetical protein
MALEVALRVLRGAAMQDPLDRDFSHEKVAGVPAAATIDAWRRHHDRMDRGDNVSRSAY